jgi:hypothetical protein
MKLVIHPAVEDVVPIANGKLNAIPLSLLPTTVTSQPSGRVDDPQTVLAERIADRGIERASEKNAWPLSSGMSTIATSY